MPRKLLLDVDPGCDDAVMIAMALGSDATDVVGVTTVAGNTTVENTTRNALAILEFVNRTDVPVAQGCGRPLEDELSTAERVHGPGGLCGDLPAPDTEPIDAHAVEFMIEQAREHGDALTICAVGPLTNLALALAIEPRLSELVDSIYLMGGAAFTAGNVTPLAEANFHNDSVAASRVIQDAAPRMVGLDVTNDATVTETIVEEFSTGDRNHAMIADWLTYSKEMRDSYDEKPAIHDATVLAHLIDDVISFEEYHLEIDTTGGPCHGAVICDTNGVLGMEANAEVALDIDVERFRKTLVSSVEALLS